jgi:acyl-CoA reductase-like NAD-dependent aldehyde dehydrogenase
MSEILKTISPVDGRVYVERPYATDTEIKSALSNAVTAQPAWSEIPIGERKKICHKAVDALVKRQKEISEEISWQMGRPISYTPGEVNGFAERARHMIDIAEHKLADIQIKTQTGFTRFIKRNPVGVVFTIAPWNYPYLTAVNSVIPAIMAGNAVLMKPSSQTPLTAERISEAFESAGLSKGVFQHLFLTHEETTKIIKSGQVDYVSFTGSVAGGKAVEVAAAGCFIDTGLELGGKDPAYVREDADIEHAAENLMDGAYFNSGQSCCGIERIYVHKKCYKAFVECFVSLVQQYRLGDPLDLDTTLGPMVSTQAAERVRQHIQEAIDKGAMACIDTNEFKQNKQDSPYLAPQVLVDVDHSMQIMREETFGPVVGIMPVSSDQEAIDLMNDSEYGLSASVWTQDEQAAIDIGNQIQTGTCFMNRCDYLDPALAWTGIKNSGKGCSLSEVGYERLTQPKSFHLKTKL